MIETAFVLIILLIILLGITEFSRGWFTKNSLKNAARHGARIASVTPSIVDVTGQCSAPNDVIVNAVCESPGVPDTTRVSLTIEGGGTAGDTVTLEVEYDFNLIVGGGLWPWDKSITLVTGASMRHE